MAVDVRILLKPDQLRSVERALDARPRDVAEALKVALNKAGGKAQTSIRKSVAAGVGTKYGDQVKRVKLVKATQKNLSATIKLKATNIVLAKTSAGGSPPAAGSYGLSLYGSPEPLPHPAFRQTMLSGHRSIFVRLTERRKMAKGRYAGKVREVIKQVYAPSPATFWEAAPGIAAQEMGKIAEDLPTQIQRAIAYVLSKRQY